MRSCDFAVILTNTLSFLDIRIFEREELSKSLQAYKDGNQDEKKYMTIDNKVYDITDFIPDHPGGEQVISTHIGKDATGKTQPMKSLLSLNTDN
jgi:cytochrome b involved in lipid metabolism